MIKFTRFIIFGLLISLVNCQDSNVTSNPILYDDAGILHPSKDSIQNIFDLMIVIFIFFLAEKHHVAFSSLVVILLSELFVAALAFLFIAKAYLLTKDIFFIIYIAVYSIFSLFSIGCSFLFFSRAVKFLHYYKENKTKLQTLQEHRKLGKIVYLVIFVIHLIFFIIASIKNYVNYVAYWVVLTPSLIFIIFILYDYIRRFKCNVSQVLNDNEDNVLPRIIGICSHFLFCATVGPNSLWIKVYLTAVAVFVTLIYRIDTEIDEEIKKSKEGNELPDKV